VNFGPSSFFRFAVGGGINTLLTYLLFLLLAAFMPYPIAYTITYAVGIALSYVINAFFVFRSGHDWKAMVRFPLAYAVQYLWGLALLWLLIDAFAMPRAIAMLAVIVTSTVLSYLLIKQILEPRRHSHEPGPPQ
jgi:putative flippase GtrA